MISANLTRCLLYFERQKLPIPLEYKVHFLLGVRPPVVDLGAGEIVSFQASNCVRTRFSSRAPPNVSGESSLGDWYPARSAARPVSVQNSLGDLTSREGFLAPEIESR